MPTEAYFDRFPSFPDSHPVIDLPKISYARLLQDDGGQREALYDAAVEYGFFKIDLRDAPGGPQLLQDVIKALDVGKAFFSQEEATKREFTLDSATIGYKPMRYYKHAGEADPSDLTEFCAVSRNQLLGDRSTSSMDIPVIFANERLQFTDLTMRLHMIATTLLSSLAACLDLDPAAFEDLHGLHDPSGSCLRYVHNPAGPYNATKTLPSLFEHTDSGTLTVLFGALGGLQILPAGADDIPDNWRWVRPEPGYAIVNCGDPLVQWTGDILRSNYHRVMHAPGPQGACDRTTFGYFLKPADDAPMRRLQQGGVIPRLEPGSMEAGADAMLPGFAEWHRNKAVGYRQSENRVKSRGGLGAQLKRQAGRTKMSARVEVEEIMA